jgi:hypothetical protein
MKLSRMGKRLLIAVPILLLATPLVLLSLARLEMTPNGVHTRLLLPAGRQTHIGIHLYSGTGDASRIPRFLDGPIVRPAADRSWQATWFCENAVHERTGSGDVLSIECGGRTMAYPVRAGLPVPPSTIDTPSHMLVLSDIEGNAAFLDGALRELKVIDAAGRWSYGSGHLVIAGDAVDRGRDVFAVLWKLYALNLQAAGQGGAVHMLLGNHEQYMLRGNVSRANREHIHTVERMGGVAKVFGSDTILGDWLRQQPVVLKAGRVLVTHGGISPAVAASGLSLDQLNAAQRRYWQGARMPSPALDAVLGPAGVTQYRGYFEGTDRRDPRATPAEVVQALDRFGVDTIVVGHTQVNQVTPLFQGRIHAIDVNSNTAASEALLFEDGVARIVPLQTRRQLPDERPPVVTRRLNLATAEDWRTIGRFLQRSYALSQLPHPY